MKILILATLLIGGQAWADQCAWNNKALAAQGVRTIKQNLTTNNSKASVYLFCEPCGDTEPQRVYVNELEKENATSGPYDITYKYAEMNKEIVRTYWEVSFNGSTGEAVKTDLAYTYVKTGTNVLTNVAKMIGCDVDGVSPFVNIE